MVMEHLRGRDLAKELEDRGPPPVLSMPSGTRGRRGAFTTTQRYRTPGRDELGFLAFDNRHAGDWRGDVILLPFDHGLAGQAEGARHV
jgi:hypothetical protein